MERTTIASDHRECVDNKDDCPGPDGEKLPCLPCVLEANPDINSYRMAATVLADEDEQVEDQ